MNINCDSNQNVCCPESDTLQSKNYSEDPSLTSTDKSTDSTTPDQYSSLDPKTYYNESLKLCESPLFSKAPTLLTQPKRFPLSPLNQLRANVDDSSRPMVNRISDGAFLGILEMVGAIFSPAPLLGCAAPSSNPSTPNYQYYCLPSVPDAGVVPNAAAGITCTDVDGGDGGSCQANLDAGAPFCLDADGGIVENDGGTCQSIPDAGQDGGIDAGGIPSVFACESDDGGCSLIKQCDSNEICNPTTGACDQNTDAGTDAGICTNADGGSCQDAGQDGGITNTCIPDGGECPPLDDAGYTQVQNCNTILACGVAADGGTMVNIIYTLDPCNSDGGIAVDTTCPTNQYCVTVSSGPICCISSDQGNSCD